MGVEVVPVWIASWDMLKQHLKATRQSGPCGSLQDLLHLSFNSHALSLTPFVDPTKCCRSNKMFGDTDSGQTQKRSEHDMFELPHATF